MGAAQRPLPDPSILLVEDDDIFAEEIAEYLAAHGMRVTRTATLDDLAGQVRDHDPRLVVLDQFVGDQDALTLLPRLRELFPGGIVVLTGNQDQVDCVIGLELGADDFVTKTQPPREILARLRAVLRRARTTSPQPSPPHARAPEPPVPPSATDWTLDAHRRELRPPYGERVALTAMEFDLLAYLFAHEGAVVSRDTLSETILRRSFAPLDRSVDNLVARIRSALRPHEGSRSAIKSIRGVGYVFVGFTTRD